MGQNPWLLTIPFYLFPWKKVVQLEGHDSLKPGAVYEAGPTGGTDVSEIHLH